MQDIEEFYILGQPIETELGKVEFIKVYEYPEYYHDLNIMALTKQHVIYNYNKINKNNEFDELIEELKKVSLYEIVASMPQLLQAYVNVFAKVFNDDSVLPKINQDNFDYYRSLILRMNCINEEEINPNPEIQKAIERSKRVKSQNNDGMSFADIVTSVVAIAGIPYREIDEMTIYKLHYTFHRIAQVKGYDTSVLFQTASSEKINIESWCKHIDLFEKEKHFVTQDEFKNTTGKVFDE